MLIELVEFNGKHGAMMLKEIAPKVLPVFEKIVKSRKNLRVTNPAMLDAFLLWHGGFLFILPK